MRRSLGETAHRESTSRSVGRIAVLLILTLPTTLVAEIPDRPGWRLVWHDEFDGSGNGTVGPSDFDAWKASFGAANLAATQSGWHAIPEPSAAALLTTAAIGWTALRFAVWRRLDASPLD